MNTNLIEQLSKLTEKDLDGNNWQSKEYQSLLKLAPTMRIEILEMAKEIEFLNQRIESLLKQLKDGSPF